ncbi:MAG TPA: S-methyl-5-thioribose-1-phosphate isomerase, partial [Ornithinibacter sp.]|nr:S-methyl-5-thioribose-1-phosphate isomerase [Ornithinibacter sp.]
MTLIAIAWDDDAGREGRGAVRLLDQTLLPGTTTDRVIDTTDDLVRAIAELAVRGAPALGVAGALGVVLAMDEG